jgi:methionyl-tRNA formyltransferase
MRAVLLTRRSPFQAWCANELFASGLLRAVIVESGTSFPPPGFSVSALGEHLKRAASLATNPARAARLFANKLSNSTWFGDREAHELRLLGTTGDALTPALAAHHVASVNDPMSIELIREAAPDLVYVFGTGILRPPVFKCVPAPFVNMHWGWSPDYRGEGIVSALALEGPSALGVTVHLIDPGVDSGPILYRERVRIDAADNFYSIGLKLTRAGVALFKRVAQDFARGDALAGQPQDLSVGRVYGSRYMRENPDLYPRAWARLTAAKDELASQART